MDESDAAKKDQLGAHLKAAYADTLAEDVPPKLQALIDQNLRKGVEETLAEGIPDRFRDLLDQLDAAASRGEPS